MPTRRHRPTFLLVSLAAHALADADSGAADASAFRQVRLDESGVVRWTDTDEEVALFGTNFGMMSGHTYYTTGLYTADRKKIIDEDFAHFARMGWNGVRLATWGDWENCDKEGNLIVNDHLDLMDYAIARGRERGVYFLFTPIHTFPPGIPREQRDALPGFEQFYAKAELGTNPAAIAAQCNYLRQMLEHVNPYTGVALKDEPTILFIEPINEPIHHPENFEGSVAYINALVDAVRATGCDRLVFFNYTQDFAMAPSLRASRTQGVSAGWYPTNLGFQHNLRGNYLRTVDDYTPLREASLAAMPRLVYEFDTAALIDPYLYPAMARAYRGVGVQFAAMFMYDPLVSAPTNFNWTTHNLNLVYTPAKAVSAIIAAEAMRRLPRGADYGGYPQNTRFGDFRVSYEENLSELNASDAFIHANDTTTAPRDPAALRRIVGCGSSPVVSYEGEGAYFLDQVRAGVWRLEVYPDAVMVRDPFDHPKVDEIKWRLLDRAWPMTIKLPDLGGTFHVRGVDPGNSRTATAVDGAFNVSPGVYVLSKAANVDAATLPARVGYVGFTEFVVPKPPDLPPQIVPHVPEQWVAGQPLEISAKIVAPVAPQSVTLKTRRGNAADVSVTPLQHVRGYRFGATLPGETLRAGALEYAIEAVCGAATVRFPEGEAFASVEIATPDQPLVLFDAAADRERWSFTRVSDFVREPQMQIVAGADAGEPAMRLSLPLQYDPGFRDYSVSDVILDRIHSRGPALAAARALHFRARGSADRKEAWLTLVERDGTGWSTALPLTTEWRELTVPLFRTEDRPQRETAARLSGDVVELLVRTCERPRRRRRSGAHRSGRAHPDFASSGGGVVSGGSEPVD